MYHISKYFCDKEFHKFYIQIKISTAIHKNCKTIDQKYLHIVLHAHTLRIRKMAEVAKKLKKRLIWNIYSCFKWTIWSVSGKMVWGKKSTPHMNWETCFSLSISSQYSVWFSHLLVLIWIYCVLLFLSSSLLFH